MLCHMYSFSCPLVVINFPAGYAQCFQVFCSVFQSSVPVKPSLHPQDCFNCPVYLLIIFLSSDIPSPIRAKATPVAVPAAITTSVGSIPLVKYPNRKIALYNPITVDNFIFAPLPLQSSLLPLQDLLANQPPWHGS